MKLAKLLGVWPPLGSMRDRLLNGVASGLCGGHVAVEWRNLEISHPEAITIGGNANLSDSAHNGCARSMRIGNGVLLGSGGSWW